MLHECMCCIHEFVCPFRIEIVRETIGAQQSVDADERSKTIFVRFQRGWSVLEMDPLHEKFVHAPAVVPNSSLKSYVTEKNEQK